MAKVKVTCTGTGFIFDRLHHAGEEIEVDESLLSPTWMKRDDGKKIPDKGRRVGITQDERKRRAEQNDTTKELQEEIAELKKQLKAKNQEAAKAPAAKDAEKKQTI